jgi:L-histidine N-alpha-methyltransferase
MRCHHHLPQLGLPGAAPDLRRLANRDGRIVSRSVAESGHSIRIDAPLRDGAERRLADDVLDGLTRPFKELPPKHFYDSRGSQLFERICELPEYYPTRTECKILRDDAEEIVDRAGGPVELVELGCGSSVKARLLLDAMADGGGALRYVPVDVSERVVIEAAEELAGDHPGLLVHGVVGDFERHLDRVPPSREGEPRVVAFLGGTIGNFPPGSRRRMLRDIARLLGPADHLLMGTDLVKDPAVIEAAYDDPTGVTAEFNRNVLHVINRELDADFLPEAFEHVAFFDRRHEWIEMRLRAKRPCSVLIGDLDLRVDFAAGEELRTEISAKFTRARVEADFASAGLELEQWYTDADELFALSVGRPA